MQLSTFTVLFAAFSSTALAGQAIVKNNCQGTSYLTITRASQQSSTIAIQPGQSYTETINGQGNSFGVTRSQDYYSASTPKLIWGFSDSPPTVYYSLNTVDGNPFASEGFTLSTSDASCGTTNAADARTRTCGDAATFTLTACG